VASRPDLRGSARAAATGSHQPRAGTADLVGGAVVG
jgi:hypothetical protein